jgi:hypothetical protein
MRALMAMAVAVSVLTLTGGAHAGCCELGYRYSGNYYYARPYFPPPPASDFSAYDYQSPGGLRGAERDVPRLQYPRPCGGNRVWDTVRDRCISPMSPR